MKRYIQNIISSFINKVIVHYKHQKAKERIVRYRKGRRTIYIIRIDFPMAGLFAIAKSVLLTYAILLINSKRMTGKIHGNYSLHSL